jgi:phage gp29-like protein
MPTVVGKYPSGTLKEQQQALLDAIDAIQNETGVKIPDSMALELLEAARQGRVTYGDLCDYFDKQMSKAVLGQTATTEGTPGKLGNEDAQENVRQDLIKADSDLLSECLNETLIRWIVDYNFPAADYPKLWFRVEAEKDLKPLAERDKALAVDIGVEVDPRYWYDTYGLPEPEGGPSVTRATPMPMFSERGRFSKEQQNIENLVARAAQQSQNAMAGLIGPIKKIVTEANSLEEIRDRLYATYSDINPDDLQKLVARAMFTAELYGRAGMAKSMEQAARSKK